MFEELFTDSARKAMVYAAEQAYYMRHEAVGTEHILLGLAREESGIAGRALRERGADYDTLLGELESIHGRSSDRRMQGDVVIPYSPRAKKVIMNATNEAKRLGSPKVGTEHLLLGLLKEEILATVMLENIGIDLNELRKTIYDMIGTNQEQTRQTNTRPFAGVGIPGQQRYQHFGGGRRPNQNQGGTPTLDSLSRDLTQMAREGKLDPIVGRDDEIRRIIQVISRRTKNNPVLVGEAGVGKTAVVEGLAQRIVKGHVPEDLANKRLMMLDVGSLVAGTKYRGEFEERMKNLMEELKNDGNTILFIDEIHTLIGAGGAEGAIDASNIMKPALARGEIQVIGATTLDEYQKYIEKDAALERRFSQVMIDEPSAEETIMILDGIKDRYEDHHGVIYEDEAIQAAVNLSSRYMTERRLPDKAIDLIDEAGAKVRIEETSTNSRVSELEQELRSIAQRKERAILSRDFDLASALRDDEQKIENKIKKLSKREGDSGQETPLVTYDDVADIVALASGVPVNQMNATDARHLVNLEERIHERLIGQEEAVSAVSRAIRRAYSGLKSPDRPIGTFLFLGPTGVGKTELAKVLADEMFGSEDNMIRVDMSEYMEKHSVSRMIGSPPGYVGYDEAGQLTEQVRNKPYSVILLDEVEKAHPDVFNILLQVFDDGRLTDGKGRTVDFRNTIIIMTSNVGATAIRDDKTVGFGAVDYSQDHEAMEKRIQEELKLTFRPEFLNRIDETIVFQSLNRDQIKEIVKINTNDVIKRLNDLEINARITDTAVDIIAEAGFDPEYGARPIRRAIQRQIEDELSEMLLSGEIEYGDDITIGGRSGEININNRSKAK